MSNMSDLKTQVQTASTGLLDRATAAEAALVVARGAAVIAIPISFETGEQLTHTVYFPQGATITRLRFEVTKAIAGTDDATIQAKNNAGTDMATGLLTMPASSALAVEVTVTPSTNNTFTDGQKAQFLAAKTTAGGKGTLFIEYTVPAT